MIRTMEVILAPNTGYMALTSAMFALGLGGIFLYLFPVKAGDIKVRLGGLSLGFALFAPMVILVFNRLPFGFEINQQNLWVQALCWAGMYITLVLPFFLAGVILSLVFKTWSKAIDRLYFFDLIAAGLACLIFIPLLPQYGPGGLIFIASAASVIAFICFRRPGRAMTVAFTVIAIALVAAPLTVDGYIEFKGHANKRNNDQLIEGGQRLMVKWDPVSKLDVLHATSNALLFSLDGGTQGSWLRGFNGDFTEFDRIREESPDSYYFGRNSIVHYFADTKEMEPEVLIIGSSAGGEMRAALTFGAQHVDAVELVGAILDAERGEFKDFGGGLYDHPKVTAIVGEGRSYLRSTDKRYDIIQMFSNHSTSSITQGATAAGVAYLQTIEAYREYFDHLSDDGILQINHHIYPRMLTTAAQAWNSQGRGEFWKHALVIRPRIADTLPTLLIKMQPWTAQEVTTILDYTNRRKSFAPRNPGTRSKPGDRIYGDKVFDAELVAYGDFIDGVQFIVGTYFQNGLDYDIQFKLLDDQNKLLYQGRIPGARVSDNQTVGHRFPSISGTSGKQFKIALSAPDATEATGFSVWQTKEGNPVINFLPGEEVPSNFIVFNPLEYADNLVPNTFLESPFPGSQAKSVPWDITPVSDYSPFFSMIRKHLTPLKAGRENMLDSNSAWLLNNQMKNGYPQDWIHLIVVAAVSLLFSLAFIALPLFTTRNRQASWPGMSRDIVYFACLGLGFIMLQVVFIQLFHKLIGFPVHTFVLVISTMLLCAGLGSMYSQSFLRLVNNRPQVVFMIIMAYGFAFILSFEFLFYSLLGFSLPTRLLCGAAMIAPLAFFMGMPFPIGILGLSSANPAAIPWAWALNGFFTVLGGYLAIVISIFTNFVIVLALAFLIYGIALMVVRKRPVLEADAKTRAEAMQSSYEAV